jgi:drug/metabolite transporter (DMT)-like permease
MNHSFSYFGEALSLSCGILWAVAVIQFRIVGESLDALSTNFYKSLFGLPVFLLVALFVDGISFWKMDNQAIFLSIVSGLLGILLADSLYLAALNRLGAGLSAVVNCLYSPFVFLFSYLILGETLTLLQCFGGTLVLLAVIYLLWPFQGESRERMNLVKGIFLMTASCLLSALSIVMIKPLMLSGTSSLLQIITFRVLAGLCGLFFVMFFLRRGENWMEPFRRCPQKKHLFGGIYLGGVLAMFIWMAAMKYTEKAAVSAILTQMTTVYVFILGVWILKEPLKLSRVFAVLLAVAGVF